MARAKQDVMADDLYGRDYCRWIEEQVRHLKEGDLEKLDLANLIDEVEDLGQSRKRAVKNNLVILLQHLLKHQFQPERRSRSWMASIVEHRRRLQDELEESPSLRRYAENVFDRAYNAARNVAVAETGLGEDAFPARPPYTLDQVLELRFLPD